MSRRFVLTLALLVPLTAVVTAPTNAADSGRLIVLNKSDHEAAVVNPTDFSVIFKLPTGKGPHEAATSPDGRTAYISNYGAVAVFRESEQQRQQYTPGNTITVLDLAGRKVKATFELGEFIAPHGIWVSRNGKLLWVTVERSQAVLELDAATGKVLKSWKTTQETSHMVVPTPNEKKLYIANIRSGSVVVIDRTTDTVKVIPTAAGTEGIAVSPDGKFVWATNRGANNISVIDTSTDAVVATFDAGGQMPIRVKFTPDGKNVWISNARSNTVSVFDAKERKLLGTIEVGAVPVGIQMTPDGKRAFIANTNDNIITVFDVPNRKVLTTFKTGTEPDGMAWAK